jgi:hypothetical protein
MAAFHLTEPTPTRIGNGSYGHEDQFQPPRLNGSCRFCEGTLIGRAAKDEKRRRPPFSSRGSNSKAGRNSGCITCRGWTYSMLRARQSQSQDLARVIAIVSVRPHWRSVARRSKTPELGDARTVRVDCRLGGVLLRYLRPWLNARADFNLARRGHLRHFVNRVDMEQLVDME